jgi:hypothetical protein
MTTESEPLIFQSGELQDNHVHETAAEHSGGCSSMLVLPPLAVMLFGGLLLLFSLHVDVAAIDPGFYASFHSSKQEGTSSISIFLEGNDKTKPGSGFISSIFTQEVQVWAPFINDWAQEAGIDPNLAAVVMQIESCGNPHATSHSGAIGLFQVMPFHFIAGENAYDPAINASRGLAYLSRSLETAHGDTRNALAGYNGGIGVIGIPEYLWKEQTRRYVTYGYPIYLDAREGESTSPKLEEWYSRFGASLCRDAGDVLGL